MATIHKRSSWTFALLLLIASFVTFSAISCKEEPGKGVWIPMPPDSSALGKIDHFIGMKDIELYEKAYTVERDSISKHIPSLYLPVSESFNKKWLVEVLKDPRCVGIRVYYGVKGERAKNEEFRMVIVGVDEEGKDLYIKKGSGLAAQAGDEDMGGLEYGQCTPPCGRTGGH